MTTRTAQRQRARRRLGQRLRRLWAVPSGPPARPSRVSTWALLGALALVVALLFYDTEDPTPFNPFNDDAPGLLPARSLLEDLVEDVTAIEADLTP